MHPVRITGSNHSDHWRGRALLLGMGCILLLLGCGTESRVKNEPSPDLPPSPGITERSDRGQRLPPPDAAEIQYDSDTQLLRLYDLPAPSRWMVHLPNERTAVPVDREYKLPEGIDPDKTMVYYTKPGGRQSKVVSLRQIQRAHEVLISQNIP